MWFEELFGFEEQSPENVREHLVLSKNKMVSKINGKSYQWGSLEIPNLEQLRNRIDLKVFDSRLRIKELVGNVQQLHCDPDNQQALFQAASQFNLLEMIGPEVTPEQGVAGYQFDHTQGPACAIACGAGTVYRNYFVPVQDKTGQTKDIQIDCLDEIGEFLDNKNLKLWTIQNGYALLSQEGLNYLNRKFSEIGNTEREHLKGKLKIGLQWNTEVTLTPASHLVSQAYCSALPVAYSHIDFYYWEYFARIILEATYEATLLAGVENYMRTGCDKVFLTLVGGGAFGNEMDWIIESLEKALKLVEGVPLDVSIVSYGSPNRAVQELIKLF